MKRWRQYLTSAGATIAVFLMVSLAFAAPGEVPEEASDKAKEVQSGKEEKTKEPKSTETDEAKENEVETEVEGEGDDVVNHGRCVSYWAHKSKADGLKGRARGQFISSIAKNEDAVSKKVEEGGTPDGTCNFEPQLEQAKEDAAASTSTARGKGKPKGGPAAGS